MSNGVVYDAEMGIQRDAYGRLPGGAAVERYVLVNGRGLSAAVMTFGATLISLRAPDRQGRFEEVTLGFDTFDRYLAGHPYFGSTVGRFANRIAGGRFRLDGRDYQLAVNQPPNHLHGGTRGFDKALWSAETAESEDGPRVGFSYISAAGEEGYPGTLSVRVTYALTQADELRIDYEATTDRATPVNLTHHGYWNLAGSGNACGSAKPQAASILGHVLRIEAERYLPTDEHRLPTGQVLPVAGTAMDFREAMMIGSRIERTPRVRGVAGYDHCYPLSHDDGTLVEAAELYEPVSGRVMTMHTTEPAVQLYTGNGLGAITGRGGVVYPRYGGVCLEAQRFPDAPNRPEFPSAILRPGQRYRQTTVHRFSTRES